MTSAEGFQRQNTTSITNFWVACQGAHTNIQQIINISTNSTSRIADKFAKEAASLLQTCIQGGITTEVEEVASILQDRVDLQRYIAFFMNKREYIVAPVFSASILALVIAYP